MSAVPNACIIYKITNVLNGKCYVGQTRTGLTKRLRSHKNAVNCQRKATVALYNAVRKYGWENFKAEVLEVCISPNELNDREVFWINQCDSLSPNGYNLVSGGNAPVEVSEELRARLSAAHKGKNLGPCTDKRRRSISEARMGQYTEAQREANKDKWKKHKFPWLGRKMTDEHRRNLSVALTGIKKPPLSEARKAQISERMTGERHHFYGKQRPPETLARMSAGQKIAWAKKKEQLCSQSGQKIFKF